MFILKLSGIQSTSFWTNLNYITIEIKKDLMYTLINFFFFKFSAESNSNSWTYALGFTFNNMKKPLIWYLPCADP